jgi:hypothetical protein
VLTCPLAPKSDIEALISEEGVEIPLESLQIKSGKQPAGISDGKRTHHTEGRKDSAQELHAGGMLHFHTTSFMVAAGLGVCRKLSNLTHTACASGSFRQPKHTMLNIDVRRR